MADGSAKSMTEGRIIELCENAPSTVREVADHFGVDERRVVEVLNGLEDGGWLEVRYHSRHRSPDV